MSATAPRGFRPAAHASGPAPSALVWRRIGRVLLGVVAVLAVTIVSLAAIAGWTVASQVQNSAIDIGNNGKSGAGTIAAFQGGFNVLLAGVDNSATQTGYGPTRTATLNDVDIVVHISADHKSGVVLSIPRDLVIAQPACTDPQTGVAAPAETADAINQAYGRGGLPCVVSTVHQLTGLDIPYAALFTFAGTVAMADAVGGVPVCTTSAINDRASGLHLPAGRSVISGKTALAYLRDRHGVGDGSDLSRISQQQAYMSSLMRVTLSSNTLANPARLYALASAASKNVSLSTSLADPATLVGMLSTLKDVSLDKMVFVQFPNQADPYNSAKVVPNPELSAVLLKDVQNDIPFTLSAKSTGTGVTEIGSSSSPSASASKSSSSSASASPSASASSSVIDGLKGQTAAQQTCSVAFGQ